MALVIAHVPLRGTYSAQRTLSRPQKWTYKDVIFTLDVEFTSHPQWHKNSAFLCGLQKQFFSSWVSPVAYFWYFGGEKATEFTFIKRESSNSRDFPWPGLFQRAASQLHLAYDSDAQRILLPPSCPLPCLSCAVGSDSNLRPFSNFFQQRYSLTTRIIALLLGK